MKQIILNYNNKLKGLHIVETIDIKDEYILIHKLQVLEKYVNLICPYM